MTTLRDVADYHRRCERRCVLRAADGRNSTHTRIDYRTEAEPHKRLAEAVEIALVAGPRSKPSLMDIPK